eukprot:1066366-Prymnesium_polylepis.1
MPGSAPSPRPDPTRSVTLWWLVLTFSDMVRDGRQGTRLGLCARHAFILSGRILGAHVLR